MDKKTNKLLEKAKEIMGKDADILIIAHKNGQCGAVIHGNTDNVTQAIFSCMHLPNNPTGMALYHIVKLNLMNILHNKSIFAMDLINSITKMLPEDDE